MEASINTLTERMKALLREALIEEYRKQLEVGGRQKTPSVDASRDTVRRYVTLLRKFAARVS